MDDNQLILNMLRRQFQRFAPEFRLDFAQSGPEALEYLKTNRPDLILLDIMMPVMTGWDVAARVKSSPRTRNIPIIFLTVKSDPVFVNLGKLGVEEYVAKPFEFRYLLEKINRQLGPRGGAEN